MEQDFQTWYFVENTKVIEVKPKTTLTKFMKQFQN